MYQLHKTYDAFPNYESAGLKTSFKDESASLCLQPPRQDLSTPERLMRFRKSHKNAPGVTITHYGKVNDLLPEKRFTYGKKSADSDHVKDVLKDDALDGLKGFLRSIKETKYASNQKEPYAHTLDRKYVWPTDTQNGSFAFGVPVVPSESAKDVLYSHPGIQDDEKIRQLYVRSHEQFAPGEQKKRDYNWSVDLKSHVFGRSGQIILNGAKNCIQPEVVDESFPKTVIVKKNKEDFKDFALNPLGAVKNLGQTNRYITSDHVYGYKPKQVELWNAGKCIHGQATLNDVKPDADLGKSVKSGYRNIPHTGDEERVFGVPTIRSDVKKPQMKSVADNSNYGDEVSAFELLNPERFHEMGVSRKDFEMLRPKEEIRKLFAQIGYGYKPGKFEGVFKRAQELCGTDQDWVSISAYIQAVKEMDHIN